MKKVLCLIFTFCVGLGIFSTHNFAHASAEISSELFAQSYFGQNFYAFFQSPQLISVHQNDLYVSDSLDEEKYILYHFDLENKTLINKVELTNLPKKFSANEKGLYYLDENSELNFFDKETEEINLIILTGYTISQITDIYTYEERISIIGKKVSDGLTIDFYAEFSTLDGSFLGAQKLIDENAKGVVVSDTHYIWNTADSIFIFEIDSQIKKIINFSDIRSLAISDEHIFVCSASKIAAYNFEGIKEFEIDTIQSNSFLSGIISNPIDITYFNGTLFVTDNNMNAVTSFILDDNDFQSGSISLYSKSQSTIYSPADAFSDESNYILDAGNHRIISDNEQISYPEHINAKKITADKMGYLYISDGNNIYSNKNGSFSLFKNYTGLIDITKGFEGGIFALLDDKVIWKNAATETMLISNLSQPLALSASVKNDRIYLLYADKYECYLFDNGEFILEETVNFQLILTTDMEVDFKGNVFLLGKTEVLRFENAELSHRFTFNSECMLYEESPFTAMCLDQTTGNLLLIHSELNYVAVLNKEDVHSVTAFDPVDIEHIDVFSHKQLNAVLFGEISSYPSNIFYYTENDEEKYEFLTAGTKVTVIDTYNEYYYILHGEKTGFVLKYGFIFKDNNEPAYLKGHVLLNNTNVYCLPSLQLFDNNAVFKFNELSKGTEVIIEGTFENGGIAWLQITLNEKPAFIPAFAVIEWIDTSVEQFNYVTFNKSTDNIIQIYSFNTLISEITASLPNGLRAKVLEDLGEWLKIEVEYHEQIYIGYVQTKYTIPEGLTNSQKLGIILLSSLAVLGILTVLIRKQIIR